MIDDTKEALSGQYPNSLTAEVLRATRFRADRREALKWVRSLRFLTFDEDGGRAHNSDGSEEPSSGSFTTCRVKRKQQCARCEEVLGLSDLHVCSKPFHNQHIVKAEEEESHPLRF